MLAAESLLAPSPKIALNASLKSPVPSKSVCEIDNYCRKSAILTCQNHPPRLKAYRTLGIVLEMRLFYACYYDAFLSGLVLCNAL
jgi:hypothetical protein